VPFAAGAAVGMLAGAISQVAFALAYRSAARRGPTRASLAGCGAFTAATITLSFLHWRPHGTDTELADKVLAGETYTEPHYLRQAQRYLGHAVRVLTASGRRSPWTGTPSTRPSCSGGRRCSRARLMTNSHHLPAVPPVHDARHRWSSPARRCAGGDGREPPAVDELLRIADALQERRER
jgi:hypothetical protein